MNLENINDVSFMWEHLHKTNGPAGEWSDGSWGWWLHNRPHRYYGPADNFGMWWHHGEQTK